MNIWRIRIINCNGILLIPIRQFTELDASRLTKMWAILARFGTKLSKNGYMTALESTEQSTAGLGQYVPTPTGITT